MNDLQPSKKLLPDGEFHGPDILLQTAQYNHRDGEFLAAISCGVLAIAMILNRRYNGFWIDPSLTPDEE